MDRDLAERFVAAALADYTHCVDYYSDLVAPGALPAEPEEVEVARTAVLAAHQALVLARSEMHQVEVGYRLAEEDR